MYQTLFCEKGRKTKLYIFFSITGTKFNYILLLQLNFPGIDRIWFSVYVDLNAIDIFQSQYKICNHMEY